MNEAFAAPAFASVGVASPGWGLVSAAYGAGVAAFFTRGRMRLLLAAAGCLALLLPGPARRAAAQARPGIEVIFLAVGQGDCTIVRLPDGSAVVVDAGGDPSGRYDPGARDVLPFLRDMGITRLAAVFVSHPHPDHLQGLPAVVAGLGTARVYASHDRGDESARAAFARMPPATQLAAGDEVTLAGVRFRVLGPPPGDTRLVENDASLVLHVSYGQTSFLLPGDVEAAGEAALLRRDPRSDVVKAPHHGSRTSSGRGLIAASRPRWVVFPVGAGNRYGFPHGETVARWRESGAELLRTDEGPVRFRSDGRSLSRAATRGSARRVGAPRREVTGTPWHRARPSTAPASRPGSCPCSPAPPPRSSPRSGSRARRRPGSSSRARHAGSAWEHRALRRGERWLLRPGQSATVDGHRIVAGWDDPGTAAEARSVLLSALRGAAPAEGVDLVAIAGPLAGRRLRARPGVLGRGPGATTRLDDPSVSRAHSRLRLEGGRLLVEDLGEQERIVDRGEAGRRPPRALARGRVPGRADPADAAPRTARDRRDGPRATRASPPRPPGRRARAALLVAAAAAMAAALLVLCAPTLPLESAAQGPIGLLERVEVAEQRRARMGHLVGPRLGGGPADEDLHPGRHPVDDGADRLHPGRAVHEPRERHHDGAPPGPPDRLDDVGRGRSAPR